MASLCSYELRRVVHGHSCDVYDSLDALQRICVMDARIYNTPVRNSSLFFPISTSTLLLRSGPRPALPLDLLPPEDGMERFGGDSDSTAASAKNTLCQRKKDRAVVAARKKRRRTCCAPSAAPCPLFAWRAVSSVGGWEYGTRNASVK